MDGIYWKENIKSNDLKAMCPPTSTESICINDKEEDISDTEYESDSDMYLDSNEVYCLSLV